MTLTSTLVPDAVPANPSPPTLEAQVSRVSRGISLVSCQQLVPWPVGTCTLPGSFYEKTDRQAHIELVVQGASAGQYVYSVSWSADGAECTTESLTEVSASHDFSGTPKLVCYSVTATHVSAGAEPIALGAHCFETAELGELGVTDEPPVDPSVELAYCVKPPVGYESAWCDTFASAISSGDCSGFEMAACEAALQSCPKLPPNDGGGGSAGAPFGFWCGTEPPEKESPEGGCSIAQPWKTGALGGASWMIVLGGVVLARRVRRNCTAS